MIAVACPACGAEVAVERRDEARTTFCPGCGASVPTAEADLSRPYLPWWESLIPWMNALIVVGVVGLSLYGVNVWLQQMNAARGGHSPWIYCVNQLKQIGLSLANYTFEHRSLPPAFVADSAGQPLHSWRVLVLPKLEEAKLYEQFDRAQPWDGPANLPLAKRVVLPLCCPGETRAGGGTYVVIVDPDGLFTGATPVALDDVTDAPADTILAIETHLQIPWSAPFDPSTADVIAWLQQDRPLGPHDGRMNVVFLDCHIESIPIAELTPQLLRAMVTRNGGEKIVRTWE